MTVGQRIQIADTALRHAMRLSAIGAAADSVLAVALAGSLRSLLFGVEPLDVASFAFGGTLIVLMVLVGSVAPAVRATRINPIVALRDE